MPDLAHHHGWDGGDRPRVLVEATEWSARTGICAVLRTEGYEAMACPGPQGADQRCSLASGRGCGAAEGADVVVHALPSWDQRNAEALRALRARLPDTPVVVEVAAAEAARRAPELEGCVVVDAPVDPDALLAAVATALGGRPQR